MENDDADAATADDVRYTIHRATRRAVENETISATDAKTRDDITILDNIGWPTLLSPLREAINEWVIFQ